MNGRPTNAKSHGGNPGAGIERKGSQSHLAAVSAFGGTAKTVRIPDNWRDRMPDPPTYYSQHVAQLGKANGTGWAQGVCPFHDDHNKSLSVCITSERGGWRCFAGCGSGDLVGFHVRLRGLDFLAAVRDLLDGGA
jgi:hypothetical protein